jgi:hypothetical protein
MWTVLLDTPLLVLPLHEMVMISTLQPQPFYAGAAAARVCPVWLSPLHMDLVSEKHVGLSAGYTPAGAAPA